MNSFPNASFPISDADQTEIIAMFIELMRERDRAAQTESGSEKAPLSNSQGSLQDH